jgi:hypothetical protein
MPTTLRNLDILFNDGSTQSTAATSGASGFRAQAFTGNGTFTIPTGVTAIKVTVVGGGGGGGGGYDLGCAGAVPASGGSGAGTAIVYLSGLTPGNTIAVTVGGAGTGGAPGANGGTGGNSSIASGTQTITTVTASGGGRGIYNNQPDGPGGTTNATLGITGQRAAYGVTQQAFNGGGSLFGFPGFVINLTTKQAASGYGAGGAGDNGSNRAGLAGTAGVVIFEL